MTQEANPSVKIRLFGQPRVEREGTIIDLGTRKSLALLSYLCLTERAISRDLLAALFWPEFDSERAPANLRSALSTIRLRTGGTFLEADRASVTLAADAGLWVDVREFRESIKRVKSHNHVDLAACPSCVASLAGSIELYRADFLEGFNLKDTPLFDEWQDSQREGLRNELAWVLERQSLAIAERGQAFEALTLARRWAALDPLHQGARRAVMRIYAQSGQRETALRQYQECERLLRAELGVAPDDETRRLAEEIRNGELRHETAAIPISGPPPPNEVVPNRPLSTQGFGDELLSTKMYVPNTRAALVPRPRLESILDGTPQGSVILVSAPAGFGKSTLIAEWVRNASLPVAWVSLDEEDNDPIRFALYVASAMEGAAPGLGAGALNLLRSPQNSGAKTAMASLVNAIEARRTPIILVLDDFQFASSGETNQVLGYLIDHMPSFLRLVISSRSDPALPLARTRARGCLVEIRMEALRFTETEAGEFFTSSMGVELSRDEVATLEERTEGWIAGLQMAGLSMRGIADPAPFIRSFGGSNRYILDYLLEEIFDRQSPEIRRLLTACSLLDFFCGELCDELTESRGCAALLKDLYKENLFLVSLDEECRYYRFHHLFADLLRHRLFRENAETAVRELHRRAGSWLARNGTVGEAIKHLIAGQDYARAAELIIARFSITIEMGLFPSFIEWINALPDELVKGWPELLVVKLFVFSLSRIIIDESLILSELEDALSAIKEEARKLKIESSISALMCILCDKRGELQEASHYADLILERNPSPDAFTRAVVSSARIKAFRSTGNWAESDRIYSEYCPAAQHEASPWFMMVVACEHLVSLMLRGRMNAAWQLCEDLIAFAQERGALSYPIVAKVYACMAEIQRERNDLEGASRSTRDSLALVELVKYSSDLIACYLLYAGISRAKGDLETSGEWIRKADDLMKAGGAYSFYGALISLERARLIYARGAIEEIDAWIEAGNGQNNGEPFLRLRFDIETARLRLLRSRILPLEVEAVRSLLASRAVEAEKAGRLRELTEIQAVNAMMSAQGFDRKRAFAELEKALSIAEPEGFARVFLDQGRAIEELLQTGIADREFKEEGVLEYATALLAAAKP